MRGRNPDGIGNLQYSRPFERRGVQRVDARSPLVVRGLLIKFRSVEALLVHRAMRRS